jgi:hypothetical protein
VGDHKGREHDRLLISRHWNVDLVVVGLHVAIAASATAMPASVVVALERPTPSTQCRLAVLIFPVRGNLRLLDVQREAFARDVSDLGLGGDLANIHYC